MMSPVTAAAGEGGEEDEAGAGDDDGEHADKPPAAARPNNRVRLRMVTILLVKPVRTLRTGQDEDHIWA
jgi:hypothetical protein